MNPHQRQRQPENELKLMMMVDAISLALMMKEGKKQKETLFSPPYTGKRPFVLLLFASSFHIFPFFLVGPLLMPPPPPPRRLMMITTAPAARNSSNRRQQRKTHRNTCTIKSRSTSIIKGGRSGGHYCMKKTHTQCVALFTPSSLFPFHTDCNSSSSIQCVPPKQQLGRLTCLT